MVQFVLDDDHVVHVLASGVVVDGHIRILLVAEEVVVVAHIHVHVHAHGDEAVVVAVMVEHADHVRTRTRIRAGQLAPEQA